MLIAVASEPTPEAPEAPSVDLLLYLGEFEDGGEFVDPMLLEESRELAPGDAPTVPETEDDDRDEAAPRSA